MSKEYIEQWNDFYKECITKPISALYELNVRNLSNLTQKSEYLTNFLNAKKWEDYMDAHIKLATAAGTEAVKYSQETFNILLEASNQAGKTLVNATSEAATKATETARSAAANAVIL